MTLPGVTVEPLDTPPARSIPLDTGVWFVTGTADRGPIDKAVLCLNLGEFIAAFGKRQTYSPLYDAADVFFREGGAKLQVGRVVGPNPVVANAILVDTSGPPKNTLDVTAISAGQWANNVSVIVAVGPTTGFVITVEESGTVEEVSPELFNKDGAIAWASNSSFIRLADTGVSGSGNPQVGTTTLASGADDRTNITEAEWQTALALFTKDLGPGQVSAPGHTTTQGHTDLLTHARYNYRWALLDSVDSGNVPTLTTAAAALRSLPVSRYGELYAPWAVVPGVAAGTTRTVPYSAIQAGMIAASEASGNSPNIAVAGANGISNYALELSQAPWSDADRETLNNAGVNVARELFGTIRTYGDRTLVSDLTSPNYLFGANGRLFMAIEANANEIAEKFLFAQIDGKGITFSKLNGELSAMLLTYYNDGALYGDTPQRAFFVDTGQQVNTPATIADGEINAAIEVRISPEGETVTISVSKVATQEAVA